MTTRIPICIVLLAAVPAAPAEPYPVRVELNVPEPPGPTPADGKIHLVYEVHATNFGSSHMQVTRLEAFDPDSGATLASYSGDEIPAILRRLGQGPDDGPADVLAPGRRGIFHLWVSVEPESVPARIGHRFWFANDRPGGEVMRRRLEGGSVEVGPPPVRISPPLRGSLWLAGNGPSNSSPHRRALMAINGAARIAQRWAIDWVQLRNGSTRDGDPKDNSTYFAWGQEALAVADGVVASVMDDVPENVPGINSRAVRINAENIGGNYVILDIGGGNYAFYAHLQPGSLRVAPGDQVKRGQVVALVGNSGNSTEPHLHFHIGDRNSPLGAEGLPFVFDEFDAVGTVARFGAAPERHAPQRRTAEIPLANVIVNFPAADD